MRILNREVIDAIIHREQQELARQEQLYRDDNPSPSLQDQVAILVDDGLATGASMAAAVTALRAHEPDEIVVAVPIAAAESCEQFAQRVDRMVCLETPNPFFGVGLWYENFTQVRDDEVRNLLTRAAERFTNQ